jgi:hypothetical protein
MTHPYGDDSTPILRPLWPRDTTTDSHHSDAAEFISIPEWARRLGISADSAYKAARLGQIPGCFAIGRLYRVNWTVFLRRAGEDPDRTSATSSEPVQGAAATAGRPVASRLPR